MALFTLNNVAFDRVIDIWGEKNGSIFYYSDEVNSANIDVTADEKEYTDNQGAVFYKTYNAKTGTVSITNAMFSTYLAAVAAGGDAEGAVSTGVPGGVRISATPATGNSVEVSIPSLESGNVKVVEVNGSGAIVRVLEATTDTLADGKFKVTAGTSGKVEVYKGSAGHDFLISYTREITADDIRIVNTANDLPKEHTLYIRALVKPICKDGDDELKLAIVKIPKFQPSPETSIALSNDQETMDFTGDMVTDYCGSEKVLYEMYIVDGDEDYDVFAIAKNGAPQGE